MTRSAYVWIPVLIATLVVSRLGAPVVYRLAVAILKPFEEEEMGFEMVAFLSIDHTLAGAQVAALPLVALWVAWGGSALSFRIAVFLVALRLASLKGFVVLGSDPQDKVLISSLTFSLGILTLMPPFRQTLMRTNGDRTGMNRQPFPWRFSTRQLFLVTAIFAVAAGTIRQMDVHMYWSWTSFSMLWYPSFALPIVPVCWMLLRPKFSFCRAMMVSVAAATIAAILGSMLESAPERFSALTIYLRLCFLHGVAIFTWFAALIVRQMGYRVARVSTIAPRPAAEPVASLAA